VIDAAYLAAMERDFATARAAGVKLIVRFAYGPGPCGRRRRRRGAASSSAEGNRALVLNGARVAHGCDGREQCRALVGLGAAEGKPSIRAGG
jgi:hypothetical protein